MTTPEYVVDKATKLETIYNRIHEVRTRFEVLLRDAEIQKLHSILDGIDPELFDLFLTSGVYIKYAEQYLQPDQLDEVNIEEFIG